jgi:hypothetical protein
VTLPAQRKLGQSEEMRAQRSAGNFARHPSPSPREARPAIAGALPPIVSTAALRTIQQLAGNRAATTALLALQRDAPPENAAAAGRIPNAQEQDQWDDPFPKDATFKILVEPTYGYNCFAWAVGDTSRDITSDTIYFAGGYAPTLDGWTKYLIERQGFSRYADGLDASADLILYGAGATQVQHAARKADQPSESLTFTSKLGERNKSPVILHDPAAMNGGAYGHVLRSFWRGAAATEPAQPPVPAP